LNDSIWPRGADDGAGGDPGSNVRQQQDRIDVGSGGTLRIGRHSEATPRAAAASGHPPLGHPLIGNEKLDSRTVKWRTGQDETAK
jgi:hypothetical protein